MAREIQKRGKNFRRYTDGTILIENVQCSYPHLFHPKAGDKGDLSYSMTSMLPKSTHKEAASAVKELMMEIENGDPKIKGKIASDKRFLKDGDKSGNETYKNCWIVTAREKKRPSVRDRDKTPMSKDDADKIEGGVFVNVLIRPWGQNNDYGKRINANLIAVQLVKDTGVRFGEGRISEDEIDETFDSYDDDDDNGGFEDDDDDMGGL
jgi:hypothetical protein